MHVSFPDILGLGNLCISEGGCCSGTSKISGAFVVYVMLSINVAQDFSLAALPVSRATAAEDVGPQEVHFLTGFCQLSCWCLGIWGRYSVLLSFDSQIPQYFGLSLRYHQFIPPWHFCHSLSFYCCRLTPVWLHTDDWSRMWRVVSALCSAGQRNDEMFSGS